MREKERKIDSYKDKYSISKGTVFFFLLNAGLDSFESLSFDRRISLSFVLFFFFLLTDDFNDSRIELVVTCSMVSKLLSIFILSIATSNYRNEP